MTGIFRGIVFAAILIVSLWLVFYVMTVGILVLLVFGGYWYLKNMMSSKGPAMGQRAAGANAPKAPKKFKYKSQYSTAREPGVISTEYREVKVEMTTSDDGDVRSAGGQR